MLRMVHHFFSKHPLTTNTVTGSLLFVVGDLLEQKLEVFRGVHGEIDQGRVARMATVGAIEGPPHYYFYKYLDKYFPGRTAKTITKKILLDQLIACPMFSVLFFIPMALMEGKNWKQSKDEFVRKFPTVYIVDWMLWPPCQLINFYLIPPVYRALYVNTATLFWNVFLSYFKHYDQF